MDFGAWVTSPHSKPEIIAPLRFVRITQSSVVDHWGKTYSGIEPPSGLTPARKPPTQSYCQLADQDPGALEAWRLAYEPERLPEGVGPRPAIAAVVAAETRGVAQSHHRGSMS